MKKREAPPGMYEALDGRMLRRHELMDSVYSAQDDACDVLRDRAIESVRETLFGELQT